MLYETETDLVQQINHAVLPKREESLNQFMKFAKVGHNKII